jgi:hypothetical protein
MTKTAKFAAAAAVLALAGCAVVPTRYGTALVPVGPAPVVVSQPFFGPVPQFGAVPLMPVPFDAPEFPLPEFNDYPDNGAVVPGPYGIPMHIPVFRN